MKLDCKQEGRHPLAPRSKPLMLGVKERTLNVSGMEQTWLETGSTSKKSGSVNGRYLMYCLGTFSDRNCLRIGEYVI